MSSVNSSTETGRTQAYRPESDRRGRARHYATSAHQLRQLPQLPQYCASLVAEGLAATGGRAAGAKAPSSAGARLSPSGLPAAAPAVGRDTEKAIPAVPSSRIASRRRVSPRERADVVLDPIAMIPIPDWVLQTPCPGSHSTIILRPCRCQRKWLSTLWLSTLRPHSASPPARDHCLRSSPPEAIEDAAPGFRTQAAVLPSSIEAARALRWTARESGSLEVL